MRFVVLSLLILLLPGAASAQQQLACGSESPDIAVDYAELLTSWQETEDFARDQAIQRCTEKNFGVGRADLVPKAQRYECGRCEDGELGCELEVHLVGFNNDLEITVVGCSLELMHGEIMWVCSVFCAFRGTIRFECTPCVGFPFCNDLIGE